jgi:hypothetical protein
MTTLNIEAEREAFEAWVRETNQNEGDEYGSLILQRAPGSHKGYYIVVRIQAAWEAWQARSTSPATVEAQQDVLSRHGAGLAAPVVPTDSQLVELMKMSESADIDMLRRALRETINALCAIASESAAPTLPEAAAQDDCRQLLDKAAWMLETYAAHLYATKPAVEEHPYVPDIESTAQDLRSLIGGAPSKEAAAQEGDSAASDDIARINAWLNEKNASGTIRECLNRVQRALVAAKQAQPVRVTEQLQTMVNIIADAAPMLRTSGYTKTADLLELHFRLLIGALATHPQPAAEKAHDRYANLLRIQKLEAESGDPYMLGLYNGMLMMCCNFDGADYVPMSKQESAERSFPERDESKPAEQQGMFRKFDVRRVDGSDQPEGKHYGCHYFVLDLNHDKHAPAAMRSYAASCAATHPELAADIVREFGTLTSGDIADLANASYRLRKGIPVADCTPTTAADGAQKSPEVNNNAGSVQNVSDNGSAIAPLASSAEKEGGNHGA